LRAPEKGHEKKQNQVGIYQPLEFEIASKVFAVNPAQAGLELQGAV
jgi:hypothetical protein